MGFDNNIMVKEVCKELANLGLPAYYDTYNMYGKIILHDIEISIWFPWIQKNEGIRNDGKQFTYQMNIWDLNVWIMEGLITAQDIKDKIHSIFMKKVENYRRETKLKSILNGSIST